MNTRLRTYLVTQDDRSGDRSTVDVVDAAIAGGVDAIQLREKHLSIRDRYRLGQTLRERTRATDVPLIVNDRVDLAVALDAEGVHLGGDDLPVAAAREVLGPDAIVGRSVSSVEGAREAASAGADYLGVGAVYATDTKDVDEAATEVGTETVAAIADAVEIPIVGIGGISTSNAREVVAAGAEGVAVVSEIAAAEDPAAATRSLRQAVDAAAGDEEVASR